MAFTDTNAPSGSADITILETSEVYVCEGLTYAFTNNIETKMDSSGRLLGNKLFEQNTTVSGTIYRASSSQAWPAPGQTFVIGAYGYQLSAVNPAEPSTATHTASITATRCVGPLITSPTGVALADETGSAITAVDGSINSLWTESSWSFSGLPTGLSGSTSTGDITGTPSATGVFYPLATVTATRTDDNGDTITRTTSRKFKWTITAP